MPAVQGISPPDLGATAAGCAYSVTTLKCDLMPILHAYLAVGSFVLLTHQMLQPTVHILVATLVLIPAVHPDCSRNVAVLMDHYMQTLKMIILDLLMQVCLQMP